MLPPRDLYLPVLPYRHNNKLYFPLCRTCTELHSSEECQHDEEDRYLSETWVTTELEEAIAHGYVVVELYEIWHWEERSKSLFSDYVNTILKVKMETSGWPANCQTEADKQEHIEHIFQVEGIHLDPSHIEFNPGKRYVAKLCLNSFWGKLAQKSNMTKSTLLPEPKEFFDLLTSDREKVDEILFLNDDIVEIQHTTEADFLEPLLCSNIVIAAFTTASARLKLYKALEVVGERILYMDTDSLVYISKPDKPEPEVGTALGELANELQDDKDYITEFVAAGAKNYGYKTHSGKTGLKVRGFTLNTMTRETLNLQSMINIVTQEPTRTVDVFMGTTIKRDKRAKSLHTIENTKQYQMVFDKWSIQHNSRMSIPFGYIPSHSE